MADYPSSLPVADPAGANLSSNPHSVLHDDMYDEIVAIATELGTNPKGTAASVKARLDLLEVGAWTSWTPAVTQGVSVAATNTRSRYVRYGRTIHATLDLSVTGTGDFPEAVTVTLPVTAAAAGPINGSGYIYDASTGIYYPGVADLPSTTTLALMNTTTAVATNNLLGVAAFTVALGSGDLIRIGFTYEAAT